MEYSRHYTLNGSNKVFCLARKSVSTVLLETFLNGEAALFCREENVLKKVDAGQFYEIISQSKRLLPFLCICGNYLFKSESQKVFVTRQFETNDQP